MPQGSQKTLTVGGGRYRLLGDLGDGHFGDVYLAEDLDEGGKVAVKLFKEGVKLDAALLEAQLQRRLSAHPRVVALRNIDARTSANPIVVTDYVPGGSVAKRIGSNAAGLLDGLRWTCDVTDALVHAHAQGIYHRDTKPSNLLIDESGHAALCDFGVAEESISETTNPVYAALWAPELAATGTTESTEVWMVGVLLYRLLVGEYPYPAGASGLPPGTAVHPERLNPQLPAALVSIMRRALAVAPADRYPTMEALRRELLPVRVVTEFNAVHGGKAMAQWEASLPAGRATVEVIASPKSTYTARLRLDRGSGPRTVASGPRGSEAQALLKARTFLRGVVEGRLP